MLVLTLAALRGLCFLLHFKSFPIVVFASCLEKKPSNTTLSNRAAQFIHPKSLSLQPRCWRGFPGSHGLGDRTETPRRTGPPQGTGSPCTPQDAVTKASPHPSCSSSGRVFLISAPSLPGLAEATAATSGEVP